MTNKIVITRDSTQITDFLTCQQYWAYRHADRLVPIRAEKPDGKKDDAKTMGTFGHLLLERYYRAMACEALQSAAMANALAFDVDVMKCECRHDLELHTRPQPTDANIIVPFGTTDFCADVNCPCVHWNPKKLELDESSRTRVRNRLKDYWYTRSLGHDFIPDSPESIEVGFSELLYEDCERMYILEGRIDMLASLVGTKCVVDHKFQLRRKSLYTRAIQCRNYALVTGRPLFIYNMIRLADKVDGQTFERPIASFTSDYLAWWKLRLINIFHKMYLAEVEGEEYERNESMCTNKYGYECEYTPLCDEIHEESRAAQQRTLYQIGEVWRPW